MGENREAIEIILYFEVVNGEVYVGADAKLGRVRGDLRAPVILKILEHYDESMARVRKALSDFAEVYQTGH